MSAFYTYHPVVNFVYFAAVIGISMVFMHPVLLILSFLSGFTYLVMLEGKKAFQRCLVYLLPLMLVTALVNPLFSHEGVTILGYLPDDNPLTLESIYYGASSATMIGAVMCHFSCFHKVMTSDKLMYLFGKMIPSLSLIFSMVLRFIPRFQTQLGIVRNAQKCVGRDISQGPALERINNGMKILSIMVTWSLENAANTADSMKSRGYGLPHRTFYSHYRFQKRDVKLMSVILILGGYAVFGGTQEIFRCTYFPAFKMALVTPYSICAYIACGLLLVCPILVEIWEVIRWKALQSKI